MLWNTNTQEAQISISSHSSSFSCFSVNSSIRHALHHGHTTYNVPYFLSKHNCSAETQVQDVSGLLLIHTNPEISRTYALEDLSQ